MPPSSSLRSEATPWLLMGGIGIAAIGGIAYRLGRGWGGELGWTAMLDRAIGQGVWAWGTQATIGAAVAAGALSAADLWVNRRRERAAVSFPGLSSGTVAEALSEVRERVERCVSGDQPDIIVAFDELLRGATQVEASDIHLSPTEQALQITYRVQGSLLEVCRLSPGLAPRLATRVKVLSHMDSYARHPQDGRLQRVVAGVRLEARVSTLPADGGERVVLRLVRGGRAVPEIADLGLDEAIVEGLREVLGKPQGLLFVTGPVGSGKTTTLYSSLAHIASTRGRLTSLVTLEDPIELQLPFATQTQINSKVGMSFAKTLRSVLRQDPNVLMLGEIRDRETAEIATQAGLTGHLILTTVHADNAAGTCTRLMDMGVEPFVLASAAVGSLSQRLIRTLCTHCRKKADVDALIRARLEKLGAEPGDGDYYEAVGCEYCEGQGYTGRAPVGELMILSPTLREAVHERRSTDEIHALAVREGMVPLIQSGLARARAGETSLMEVLRVAG